MPPCVQNHIRSHRLVITCTGMYCIIGRLNSYFFSLSVYQTICAALIDCYSIRDGFRPNVQFNVCRLFVTSIYSGKEKKKEIRRANIKSPLIRKWKKRISRDLWRTHSVSHRRFSIVNSSRKTKQNRGYTLIVQKKIPESKKRTGESQHSLGSNSKCCQWKTKLLPFKFFFFFFERENSFGSTSDEKSNSDAN